MRSRSLFSTGILFLLFGISLFEGPLFALKKKTRVWTKDIVVQDITPVKLVARLQFRQFFKWQDLSNQTIKFYIDHIYVGSATTESDGIARLFYLPKESGRWSFTVSYEGNAQYKKSEENKCIFAVELAGKTRSGFCPKCFQLFQTQKNKCLRCRETLQFESKETNRVIENSLNRPMETFFPLERILGICSFAEKQLLVLTEKSIFRFDGYRFHETPLPPNSYHPSGFSEMLSMENNVYFATQDHIFHFFIGPKEKEMIEVHSLQTAFPEKGIRKLLAGRHEPWLLGQNQLIAKSGNQFFPKNDLGTTSLALVRDLVVDPQKNIWVVRANGLYVFYGDKKESDFFPFDGIEECYWNEQLFIRTAKDLLRFEHPKFTSVLPDAIKTNTLQKVFFQKEGSPVYLLAGDELFYPTFGKFSLQGKLSETLTISSAVVHLGKTLWLGTRNGLVMIPLVSERENYPLTGALTGLGVDAKNQLILGNSQGCKTVHRKLVSGPASTKWIKTQNNQTLLASSSEIFFQEKEKNISFQYHSDSFQKGFSFQKQFFLLTEHTLYRYQNKQYERLWHTPAKIHFATPIAESLFLGTSQGLFQYRHGQIQPETWAGTQEVFCLETYQNNLYAGTTSGVYSNKEGQNVLLQKQACKELLRFQEKLYLLTSEKLYVLEDSGLSELEFSSPPLSIAAGFQSPLILTQQSLELLPDVSFLEKGAFHYLLPLASGFLGLTPDELIVQQQTGTQRIPLEGVFEGALPFFENSYLLWNSAREWFLLQSSTLEKINNIEAFLKNPVEEIREEGSDCIAKTSRGEFLLTSQGWKPYSGISNTFRDNEGNEWKLQENKLVGPKITFDTLHLKGLRDLITVRENSLWIQGSRFILKYNEDGSIQTYPTELQSISDLYPVDEKIYCASNTGFFVLEKSQWTCLSKERVRRIEKDPFGNLWIFGDKSLLQMDPSGKISTALQTFTDFFKIDDQLYFNSSYQGIYIFDGKQFKKEIVELPNYQIQCIYPSVAPKGYWVGTHRGLFFYQNGKFIAYRNLVTGSILSLKKGPDDSILVCSQRGFFDLKLSPQKKQFPETCSPSDYFSSISLKQVIENVEVLPNGNIYFASRQGLFVLERGAPIQIDSTVYSPQKLTAFGQKLWFESNGQIYWWSIEAKKTTAFEEQLNRKTLPSPSFKEIFVYKEYLFFFYPASFDLYYFHPEKGIQNTRGHVMIGQDLRFWPSEELLLLSSSRGLTAFREGKFERLGIGALRGKPVAFHYPHLYYHQQYKNKEMAEVILQYTYQGSSQTLHIYPEDDPFKDIFFLKEETLLISEKNIVCVAPGKPKETLWSNKKIYGAAQDSLGTLFILELKGLYRYEKGAFVLVSVPVSNPYFIGKNTQGKIFIAGSKSLHLLGTNFLFRKKDGFQGPIESIKTLSSGDLLLRYLNQDYGILSTQNKLLSITNLFSMPSLKQDCPIVVDSEGTLWFVQGSSVYFFNKTKAQLWKSNTSISSLIVDGQGQMYGLSREGLILVPEGELVKNCPQEKIHRAVLNAQGVLYCLTTKQVGSIQNKKYVEMLQEAEAVSSIFPDLEGNVLGLLSDGIAQIAQPQLQYRIRNPQFKTKKFQIGMVSQNGEIFVGNANGLFSVPEIKARSFPISLRNPNQAKLTVSEKTNGLWIETKEGLYLLTKELLFQTLYNGEIRNLGDEWFSTEKETGEWIEQKFVARHAFPSIVREEISSLDTLFVQKEQIYSIQGLQPSAYQLSPFLVGTIIENVFFTEHGAWVITNEALCFAQIDCFKIYPKALFTKVFDVVSSFQEKRLSFWFATNKGVFRFEEGHFLPFPQFPESVSSLGVFGNYLLLANPTEVLQYSLSSSGGRLQPFSEKLVHVQQILQNGNFYLFCTPEKLYSLVRNQTGGFREITTDPYLRVAIDSVGGIWVQYSDRIEFFLVEDSPPISKILHWEDFYDGNVEVTVIGQDYFYEGSFFEYAYRLRPVEADEQYPWSEFTKQAKFKFKEVKTRDYYLEVKARDTWGNEQKAPTKLLLKRSQLVFQND